MAQLTKQLKLFERKSNMPSKNKIPYLMVGVFNTIIGYCIGVYVYKIFAAILDIIWIGVISNALSITVSFITYKTLVFKTKGMWLSEYLRCYVVYGGIALIGIFFLWIFVEKMGISIWFAQALVIGVTIVTSYVGHSRFTFRGREISN